VAARRTRTGAGRQHDPKTDFLRWVTLRYVLLLRPVNPTNAFTLTNRLHGQWNLLERRGMDFRYLGSMKPGKPATVLDRIPGTPDCDKPGPTGSSGSPARRSTRELRGLYTFDNQFMQMALQTDYLHGRLERAPSSSSTERHLAFNPSWSTA